MRTHPPSIPIRMGCCIDSASKNACGSDARADATAHATGDATGHASTEISDLDLCTTTSGTGLEVRRSIHQERSAAAPRNAHTGPRSPSPLSAQPAPDGNYAVIERIAHEAFDQLRATEPSADVVEHVKQLCAQRHIDYGRQVQPDVVRRAVESAAAQRTLVPVHKRGRGGTSSLADMVTEFRARLDAMRPPAKES